jgi:phosphoribosylanthranilate isomerase
MTRVKICGITNVEDALQAVEAGADALGFVFFKESPRHISHERAGEIIERVPAFVNTVGVFVNEPAWRVEEIMRLTGLDMAQLHGEESPVECCKFRRAIKALRVEKMTDLEPMSRYKVSAFLLDAYSKGEYGGTGRAFNWDIAVEAKKYGNIILAGGLNPGNVAEAVRHVRPFAVDVSSGVEADKGVKDHEKVRQFIRRARHAMVES